MVKESLKRAQKKYDADNCSHISLKFNNTTDSDILQALENVTSKQAFIKDCIRFFLKNNKNRR